MTDKHGLSLEALKAAIQMETDGKAHYLKASQESSDELGKKLLQTLAEEEDNHRRKFEQIYNTMRTKKSWPVVYFQPDGGQKLRTIFARATEKLDSSTKPIDTELAAVELAMSMENESLDFYKSQSEKTTDNDEKEFYQLLALEEREHHMILLDYYDYLKDPAGWFVRKEHPSLDGG
ncbi:ferritin family protein [Chloroflexota bacterium]